MRNKFPVHPGWIRFTFWIQKLIFFDCDSSSFLSVRLAKLEFSCPLKKGWSGTVLLITSSHLMWLNGERTWASGMPYADEERFEIRNVYFEKGTLQNYINCLVQKSLWSLFLNSASCKNVSEASLRYTELWNVDLPASRWRQSNLSEIVTKYKQT